jgi:hypothetical protein
LDGHDSTFSKTLNHSVPMMFIASFYCSTFVHSVLLFDSMILFDYSVFDYSVNLLFCILGISIPHITKTIQQSINIINQSAPAPSLSKWRKGEAYYNHRHRGYAEPISPYGLSTWQDMNRFLQVTQVDKL